MPCDTPPPPSPVADDDLIEEVEIIYDDPVIDTEGFELIDEMEFELGDNSITTFDKHKEPVFCCSFNNSGSYVVTGGQDDTAFVWDPRLKTVKFECLGHKDSVIAASFSPDSQYVVTADMSGGIRLWKMSDGSLVWDFEIGDVQWLKWLNRKNSFIAADIDGNCWKWTVPSMEMEMFSNPTAGCCTGSISHDDEIFVTGYIDGTLKLWSFSKKTALATLSGSSAHKEAPTTIKFNEENTLILTGSEDGTSKLIKVSDFKVLWTLNGCNSDDHEHDVASVEDVGFCHSLPYIVVGTNCGILSIWDMNTKTRRTQTEANSSIIKIICDNVEPIVYAAIGDGSLQILDARSGEVVERFHGHKAAILDLALSSCRKFLLTASDDHTCKIFERDDNA